MKLTKLAMVATMACMFASTVFADQTNGIRLVSCDCGEPVCGCEASCDTACEAPACEPTCAAPCCDNGCAAAGCDNCCDGGCDSGCGGCDSGCGMSSMLGGMFDGCGKMGDCGDCCLGDPYTLFGDCDNGWSAGGWLQLGYTSNALPAFNNRDGELQLQQAWLYAEKTLDTDCGFDWGGRVDYLYGTDGPNTQAFGTGNRGWDNGWDNGPDDSGYGSALPQLYGEVGYGDLSIKAGHFYTIIGYEVVPATGNFFYSHAYTFNFSEPFTHTGALATYNVNDDVTAWAGYSLGWDSGFDDNGDAFLGGISAALTDDLTLTYATIGGRFVEPWSGVTAPVNQGIRGYQHSIVADYACSDTLQYIFQSDVLGTDFADGTNARDTFGINQYLIKQFNDCWGIGARFEWWNVQDGPAVNSSDIYALTLGLNHRPCANIIIRPEIRWDWNDDQVLLGGSPVLENNDDNQTTFGVDTILTF